SAIRATARVMGDSVAGRGGSVGTWPQITRAGQTLPAPGRSGCPRAIRRRRGGGRASGKLLRAVGRWHGGADRSALRAFRSSTILIEGSPVALRRIHTPSTRLGAGSGGQHAATFTGSVTATPEIVVYLGLDRVNLAKMALTLVGNQPARGSSDCTRRP